MLLFAFSSVCLFLSCVTMRKNVRECFLCFLLWPSTVACDDRICRTPARRTSVWLLASHTGGSYSFRIVNARSTESIEVCPLPIGKAFKDLTRRAVDLDLDLSARVLSRSLKRPLAMVHWKGLAGNVRMKADDQAINFEWTTLQEPLASGAVDDGAYPTLEDSDIDAIGATAASDVLNEWGLGARFFISNLIVCTPPEINNGFPI